MDEAELRQRAERRVLARRAVWSHVFTYVLVNSYLFATDWWHDRSITWAFWPAAGWGLGLVSHVVTTAAMLDGGRERAVQREMERLRSRS